MVTPVVEDVMPEAPATPVVSSVLRGKNTPVEAIRVVGVAGSTLAMAEVTAEYLVTRDDRIVVTAVELRVVMGDTWEANGEPERELLLGAFVRDSPPSGSDLDKDPPGELIEPSEVLGGPPGPTNLPGALE